MTSHSRSMRCDRPAETPARLALAFALSFAVFILGLLAVSPDAHAEVHCDADDVDHFCPVITASTGFCNTAEPVTATAGDDSPASRSGVDHREIDWTTPAYWHRPAIGPPCGHS